MGKGGEKDVKISRKGRREQKIVWTGSRKQDKIRKRDGETRGKKNNAHGS